jgi:acyl-CoA thioester hydrolase
MSHEFIFERRVEFAETDMAGIVHFANYYRYMEAAEHAFFRSLGFTLHERTGEEMTGWARVDARCEFRRPLRYPDVFQVHLRVVGKGRSSLEYELDFRHPDEPKPLARGFMKVVCVSKDPGDETIRARPIPAEIAAAIDVAPDREATPLGVRSKD